MRALSLLLCCLAGMAFADAEPYKLDTARSEVGFSYEFEGQPKSGTMPVQAAQMRLDLDNIANSTVDVTLNAAAAKAGFIFATQTMKGPQVLDTDNHPTIRFRSTALSGDMNGAAIKGKLTVRGVTKPVTLQAKLYRQSGTELGDRSKLSVLLTGQIDRNAFGAGGFPGYVGPTIGLRILARINR
ncbi:MAG: YceI family protein [Roseovarius sp.]